MKYQNPFLEIVDRFSSLAMPTRCSYNLITWTCHEILSCNHCSCVGCGMLIWSLRSKPQKDARQWKNDIYIFSAPTHFRIWVIKLFCCLILNEEFASLWDSDMYEFFTRLFEKYLRDENFEEIYWKLWKFNLDIKSFKCL